MRFMQIHRPEVAAQQKGRGRRARRENREASQEKCNMIKPTFGV